MKPKDFPELRILAILGIIALGWHLVSTFWSFLGMFADIFILLVLSWVLAFILEPLVIKISKVLTLPRLWSAALVYFSLGVLAIIIIWAVLPTVISQISQFAFLVPNYLPENFLLGPKLETFINNTANNTISLASGVASTATGILLVFILSFYFLMTKEEISKFILKIIPHEYEKNYLFLEKTINETFASFLQIQIVMGLVMGGITLVTLLILGVNFPLSTSLFSAILAMIPVVGAVIFLIPVVLAGLTVSIEKTIIAVVIILLAAQLVFNILGPKLLGSALKIHPIVILLSFIIGYRLAGVWGAIFAVPITSALFVIVKDLLKYWRQEADK